MLSDSCYSPQNSALSILSGPFYDSVRLIWSDRISEYFLATDARRQVWHSWITARQGETFSTGIRDFLSLAKSKDIVSDGFGMCPVGFLSALKRSGATARQPIFYRNLFEMLTRGGSLAKLIYHCREFNIEAVTELSSIPSDEFSTQVLAILIRASVEPDRLCGAVWLSQMLRGPMGADVVIGTLGRTSNPIRALQSLLLQLPLPAPPRTFSSPLFPVKDAEEIRVLSRQFRNCLRNIDQLSEIIFSIQSGRQYLYRWDGEEAALILLTKFGPNGWVIEEARGIENRRVSQQSQQQIELALGGDPTICPAWPSRQALPTREWFFS